MNTIARLKLEQYNVAGQHITHYATGTPQGEKEVEEEEGLRIDDEKFQGRAPHY